MVSSNFGRGSLLACVTAIGASIGCASATGNAPAPSHDAGTTHPTDAGADAPSGSDAGLDVPIDSGIAPTPDTGATTDAGTDATTPTDSGPPPSDGATTGYGPYGSDGTFTVTTATIQVPAPNGTFNATVFIPSGSTPMPVVILSSGLQQPAAAYAPYGKRLASWGIVTFTRDDPGILGSEQSPALAQDVAYIASTFLATANTTASGPLQNKVDSTRVGLAGHSRGGQVSLLAAGGPAKGLVKGVFGIDPVDSAGDGGVGEAASVIGSVGVPLAFLGETTDDSSTSCAPAADNYQMLYGAASSPIVAITAINADHTMFEDPSSCSFCAICTAGTAKQTDVIAYSVRYVTAFFARELLGDATVGATFDGAGATLDTAAGLVQVESK